MPLRDLNQISIERDFSETSQKHLKREDFFCYAFQTSQRCLFSDIFKTSQKLLKEHVFSMRSLRCLDHIFKKISIPWHLWDVSKTSLASINDFSEIAYQNDFVWYPLSYWNIWTNRCGTLRNTPEMERFWELGIDINLVCHEYQLADIYMRVLTSQRSSKPNSKCII